MTPYIIEIPVGPVDGVNKQFSISMSYQPGTLQVWLNGQLKRQDDAIWGYTELGGADFELATAPEVGDILQVGYRG